MTGEKGTPLPKVEKNFAFSVEVSTLAQDTFMTDAL